MKMKPQVVIAIVLVIVAAGIGIAMLGGGWNTNSSNGNGLGNGQGNGNGGGNGIRGSSSFAEISSEYDIPETDLMTAFGVLGQGPNEVTCSSLTELYPDAEIGTGSVRMFVALYLGEAYEFTSDASLPEAGVQILRDKQTLTTEQNEYLESHTVQISE